jgi:fluoroacetyl-CoA thioesterase
MRCWATWTLSATWSPTLAAIRQYPKAPFVKRPPELLACEVPLPRPPVRSRPLGKIETLVDDKLVVKHMGGEGVLSTPSMIMLMERAGIEAVQAHLPEGHTTVGFEVNVKHFGATPKGEKVTVTAELLDIDGRKLRFKVEAFDEHKKVGDGTHRRAIIKVEKT